MKLTKFLAIAVTLVGLSPLGAARADDGLRVDVVVDLTDAGKNVAPPSLGHPTYYYPIVKGYTPGGAILVNEKAPTAVNQIEHLLVDALAKQGYLLARKSAPPTLLLMFWWGYKAPVNLGPSTNVSADQIFTQTTLVLGPGPEPDGGAMLGEQGPGAAMMGKGALPDNPEVNNNEMSELVLGSQFEAKPDMDIPSRLSRRSLRLEMAWDATHYPRYYLMVSALDFRAATEHKKVSVLWTARVSTEVAGHNLEQVLPTLIAEGAPLFGRNTNGPRFTAGPAIPMAVVTVGTPVVKGAAR